jgi:hypothetical protein
MPEPVLYRNKKTQSGIFMVRYRTEMTDAGMPMPALVFWMPMPNYARDKEYSDYQHKETWIMPRIITLVNKIF